MQNIKDGYYLSIYSCLNKYLNNNKVSMRHDHNMSLWGLQNNKLELIHHWEFERITGLKHHGISFYDKESAIEFINMLLNAHGLCIDDIVHIFGTPELSNVTDYYNKDLGPEFTYHSLAHVFSSLMIDTDVFYNEDILCLALDGGSDYLIDNGNYDNRFDFLCAFSSKGKIQYFNIPSPGQYWYSLKYITGMEEGSLMALATATKCRVLDKIYNDDELIEVYKTHKDSPRKIITQMHERIFSYTKEDLGIKFEFYDNRFTEEENKLSMLAKIVQDISIKQVCKIIDQAIEKYKFDPSKINLALSGGYALNCPTNTFLMHKYNFKKQLIAPCVNDGGQAIGMGLYYFYKKCDYINFKLKHPYYGDMDSNINVLQNEKYKNHIESVEDTLDFFVEDVKNDPIVWFDGCAEIGPRALGHRSILANPAENRSKDLLNLYKKRQWWRPVAPIILYEELNKWFEDSFESPYMLNNFVLKEDKKDIVPAIVHIDQTARVQTVHKNIDDRLYSCLKKYFHSTGIPILCNTSLNDKGEPIINTIEEALNFALRKGIKVIYINGIRVVLKRHSEFFEQMPTERKADSFLKYAGFIELKLSPSEYFLYFINPQLYIYNLENEDDVRKLKHILKKIAKISNILEFENFYNEKVIK